MEARIDYGRRFPEVRTAMWALEHYVHRSGLDPKLLELVKLRASLINGCAYCVDMHTKVARSLGETEQRLYEVSLWREAPFYTERERAALAWTEAVTLIHVDHVPDDVYEMVRRHFDEKELVAENPETIEFQVTGDFRKSDVTVSPDDQTQHRRPHPPPMAAAYLEFDLERAIEQLRHEREWTTGQNAKTLVKYDDLRVVLTALRTHAGMPSHQTQG